MPDITAVRERSVAKIVDSIRTLEGGGFPVRRPFPVAGMLQVDPFLLLDHLGPVKWGPGQGIGAPDHPHRGFETVTYLLSGEMQHKDSVGHTGRLRPGDVQWMTAGAGVVHSELPSDDFMKNGGVMHGFQIWVNLPARDKMIKPRYQDIPAARIPEATSADGRVKVRIIAGQTMGKSAVIDTRTPIMYLHYTLQPGGETVPEIPRAYNALVYVIRGRASVGETATAPHLPHLMEGRTGAASRDTGSARGPRLEPIGDEGKTVREGQMAQLSEGESVRLAVEPDAGEPADLLLLAGAPINEPVARHGPFVMNTEEEILQAIRDYRSGQMGRIDF